ncbi:rhomboid family-domain-containing protein [Gongronella butleri]|nr:rhomboid family-domain-containing protein [Gongronella butleri]
MRNEWIAVFRTGVRPFSEKRWPVVANYVLLVMMFTILSGELLLSQMTSSEFVELDPFNVMLGPSLQILIQSGARFPPCMRPTAMMPASDRYVCLNTTVPLSPSGGDFSVRLLDPIFERASPITQSSSCSLQDICGMSGFVHNNAPDQTFRFFTPMFVHTGIVHFAINALAHWFLTLDMERVINPIRFTVLYILCGVFGNLMGANFAMPTNPFMGCSTAVFGILGCTLIDVIYMWRYVHQPFRHLIKVTMIIGCCFVLGLLPGVDNFSHMGGLLAGLMLGPTMLPAHPRSRREQWVIRIVCALGIGLFIALTVLLWRAFFQGSDPGEMCVFCRNISCLPIGGFCD